MQTHIKRMVSYFARHEVDKKGKGWKRGSDVNSRHRYTNNGIL